jgi:glycogen synthase
VRHLIISREYPPAAYPPGGIGTYVANIARLLAEKGETVHVIGQRWEGARAARESFVDGRLIVHRIGEFDLPRPADAADVARLELERDGLRRTAFPQQWFAWHAAFLAERLIEEEGIDVVEGQEWEAPLYHLLLRRALGFGPARRPPCIVHLHSAATFIRRYNGAPDTPPAFPQMSRLEAFCIRAADAHLCPSQYYGRQAAAHFGLAPDAVKVIPLPVGATPFIERAPEVWERGSICFVGRLEPRKGIIEWMAAAERVAKAIPDVTFDFVGADVWRLQPVLEGRLAPELRSRFRFHGSKPREEVLGFLAQAGAAAVPSRWENFPNVCVEAMRTGLPVIATRLGGMVELLEDGRTGWLAPDTGVAGMTDGLEEALGRCLAAPAEERALMGRAASETIARICDNDAIVGAHLDYRLTVAERGARTSSTAPLQPAQAGVRPASAASEGRTDASGAGIVIRTASPRDAAPLLRSLNQQTIAPAAIALVCEVGDVADTVGDGIIRLDRPDLRGAAAWNAGHSALLKRKPSFWLFLDQHDALAPRCLERMGQVLAKRPDVGLVAPWTLRGDGAAIEAPPPADVAHQLIRNDLPPATAVRAEALGADPPFRQGMPREADIWDLANSVLLRGWAAASLPEALARRDQPPPQSPWPEMTALRAIREEIMGPLEARMGPAALEIVDLYVPLPMASPRAPSRGTLAQRGRRYLTTMVFEPRKALCGVIRRARAFRRRRI